VKQPVTDQVLLPENFHSSGAVPGVERFFPADTKHQLKYIALPAKKLGFATGSGKIFAVNCKLKQLIKQYEKFVANVLLLNSPAGTFVKLSQSPKHLAKFVT
jgi:hypothetical protein